jgi:hypothetical protein
MKKPKGKLWMIFVLIASFSPGCQPFSAGGEETPIANFIPPTFDPAAEVVVTAVSPMPTRQVNCDNQLRFLDDLSIPDGMEVSPGQELSKRWLIRNDGSCNWNRRYSLELISGLALGASKVQELYPARQSTDVVVEIIFTAPDNPGRYNSWWQAYDPDGNRFGDPIYMEISVLSDN